MNFALFAVVNGRAYIAIETAHPGGSELAPDNMWTKTKFLAQSVQHLAV